MPFAKVNGYMISIFDNLSSPLHFETSRDLSRVLDNAGPNQRSCSNISPMPTVLHILVLWLIIKACVFPFRSLAHVMSIQHVFEAFYLTLIRLSTFSKIALCIVFSNLSISWTNSAAKRIALVAISSTISLPGYRLWVYYPSSVIKIKLSWSWKV